VDAIQKMDVDYCIELKAAEPPPRAIGHRIDVVGSKGRLNTLGSQKNTASGQKPAHELKPGNLLSDLPEAFIITSHGYQGLKPTCKTRYGMPT
jgi:hypothetical protein